MLGILTATGARPEAWAICERLMLAQTYAGRVAWIIVDDGPMPQTITFAREGWELHVVRPAKLWSPGMNTQARNVREGIATAEQLGIRELAIIEDDDFYHPGWLDTIAEKLKAHELVGEQPARYYNMRTMRYRQMHNRKHASLAATAVRGAAIETLKRVCSMKTTFIDLALWELHRNKSLFAGSQVIGVKGLPGRPGIGCGHNREFGTPDPRGKVKDQWFGDGAVYYG